MLPLQRNILVYNKEGAFLRFQQEFRRTVDLLEHTAFYSATFNDFLSELSNRSSHYSLLLVDSGAKDLDLGRLKDTLQSEKKERRPGTLLFIHADRADPQRIEDQWLDLVMDCAAHFFRDDRPAEISFVLNRLLFPGTLEDRKQPRALVRCRSEISTNRRVNRWLQGQVFNLSMGGAFLETEKIEPKQKYLRVRIFPDDNILPWLFEAHVVHTCDTENEKHKLLPHGMGVCFLPIDAKTRGQLDNFLEDRYLPIDQKQV